MDDFLKDSIKTPEQEEIVRKLYEKAKGLDHFTEKNNQLKEQITQLEPQVQAGVNLKHEMDYYNNLIQKGHLHQFTRTVGIPDDKILELAHNILSLNDLTPAQVQQYNTNIENNTQLYQTQLQNQQLQTQAAATSQAQLSSDLDLVMQNPEFAPTIAAFEQRNGQGSFRNEIINRASVVERTQQKTLTPLEAVTEYVNLIGKVAPQPAAAPAAPAQAAPVHPGTAQPQAPAQPAPAAVGTQPPTNQVVVTEKPTIPNVQAGGQAPAKKQFKSIADLKSHYAKTYATGNE